MKLEQFHLHGIFTVSNFSVIKIRLLNLIIFFIAEMQKDLEMNISHLENDKK